MLGRNFLGLILASSLSFSISAHAGWDFLKPAKLIERIQKGVAKQQIGSGVNLVSAEIVDGISTSLKYRIEAEPSYINGFYTRIDKYTVQFNLTPGDFIDDLDTPVGVALQKNSEIIFARQFSTQAASLTALPYTPRNLPFTAQRAIERLQPGDFVAFQGRMALIFSLGTDVLKGDFKAGASTHAVLSGDFMVHLYRMNNNKMRVKLIAIREKSLGVDAGVDLEKGIDIVGINIINERIEKWLNITPFSFGANTGSNDVIMLDYVFDLNNAQAAAAYDSLMMNKVQLQDVKVANPNASRKDLTKELLTDLTAVESVALEDALLPPTERRIDRVFKGSSEGYTKDARIKFGLNLWKFESGNAYGQNKVLSYDKQDKEEYFLLDTLSRFKKTKILFGLFGEETLNTSNLLFTADSNFNPQRFVTLTSSAEMKMKDLSRKDLQEIQRLVRETIGTAQYRNINWSNWEQSDEKKINAYFKQEVFFNPEALNSLPRMSENEIANRFKQYIKQTGRPRSRPFVGGNSPKDYILNWIYAFTGDARFAASQLVIVIDPTKTVQERFTAFERLHQLPIWKERGIGFLISFIPESQRPEFLRYELVVSAKGMNALVFNFGYFKEEKLYRSLIYIQNVIRNRSFDLRLYTDTKGEFHMMSAPAPVL